MVIPCCGCLFLRLSTSVVICQAIAFPCLGFRCHVSSACQVTWVNATQFRAPWRLRFAALYNTIVEIKPRCCVVKTERFWALVRLNTLVTYLLKIGARLKISVLQVWLEPETWQKKTCIQRPIKLSPFSSTKIEELTARSLLLLLCSTQPNSQMASTKGEEGGGGGGGGGKRWVKKGRGLKVQWMEHGESRWLRWKLMEGRKKVLIAQNSVEAFSITWRSQGLSKQW